jgi:hypothetical protein
MGVLPRLRIRQAPVAKVGYVERVEQLAKVAVFYHYNPFFLHGISVVTKHKYAERVEP